MTSATETRARDALRVIWERRREEVEGRVQIIANAALALMEDGLTSALLGDAIVAAHKLTGTLGTFGFAGGSGLAREVEALLRAGGTPPERAAAVRLSELVLGLQQTLESGPAALLQHAEGSLGQEAATDVPKKRRVGVDARTPTTIRAALTAGGLEVVEVDTGDATIDPSNTVAMLVLHVEDDSDDGYDRCHAVRKRCSDPAVPIILAIPRQDAESIRRVFAVGADDFVVWPIVGPELLARVDGYLERLRLRAALPFASDDRWHSFDTGADRQVDVVVVDDDSALSDLLDHTLRLRGYSVERFFDGADALAALVGDPPRVSSRAILLDVGLPGLDGIAVLRRLRREGVLRRTRVLMLTSHSTESDVLGALQLGAFDHVPKPFSVPALMHRLQRALMC